MSATRTRTPASLVPAQPSPGSLVTTPRTALPSCPRCEGSQVTELAMTLTDGSPVTFSSCHRCEHRSWRQEGVELTREAVLDKARKRV